VTGNDVGPVRHLIRHADQHSDTIAIVYEGTEWTYREFCDLVHGLASAMRADGIGPGDRIAYAGANSLTFIAGYFAASWIGAAFVPLNFRLAGPELRLILLDARPDVLIAEPVHASLISPFLHELSVRRPLLVDDDPGVADEEFTDDAWQSYRAFRASSEAITPAIHNEANDLAVVLYTSGTTGRSKGVMLTHGNIWWNWANVDSVVDTRVGDVYLAVAPLFHIGGLNALTLRTLTRGGTVVIRRTFDAAQTLEDLVAFQVTSIFVVPAMLSAIQRVPGFADADLNHLRSAIAAGAPVPPALIASYAERGVYLQQAWGLTETSPFSTYLESDRTLAKLGSCGVPMPYTEVKIVDPASHGDVVGPDATGEFWVRGPNVSPGYWNNPEGTAAAFTPDGWFRTGDIGYRDADGYFYIVDRLKDMIISGGENVYPAEIENVLNAHPRVLDVAVVGIPDEKWGEAVCAVVAVSEGTVTLEEIREFASLSIARYKLPTRLVLQDEVPRNGAGKLDKPTIRARVADHLERHTNLETASFTETLRVPHRRR
jgi:fatty-acyl-CoA synthase